MYELIIAIGLIASIILIKRSCGFSVKAWFAWTMFLAVGGHAMNVVAIRANDGQMPVINSGLDWNNAPRIPVPSYVADWFLNMLGTVQKTVARKDDVHRYVSKSEEGSVRLRFLADRFPLKMGDQHQLVYSVGDVVAFVGIVLAILGLFPVWLICRRKKKKASNAP